MTGGGKQLQVEKEQLHIITGGGKLSQVEDRDHRWRKAIAHELVRDH
jgi:hypothetical protein